MDIAKIRKKLQAQEKKSGEPQAPAPAEPEVKAEPAAATEARHIPEPPPPAATQLPELPAEIPETIKAEPQKQDNGKEELRDEDSVELLTFSLSHEEFAFRVPDVEEIVRFQKITRVPTLPAYVVGITSLRGKIIPVLDLKARLNISGGRLSQECSSADLSERAESGADEKILIVSGTRGMIGAIIDRVLGVIRISKQEILDPPAHLSETELKFIEGVVIYEKRFISIIQSEDTLSIEAS